MALESRHHCPIPVGFAFLLSHSPAVILPCPWSCSILQPRCPTPEGFCSSGPQADQNCSFNPLATSISKAFRGMNSWEQESSHCSAWGDDECSWVQPRKVPEALEGYGEPTNISSAVKSWIIILISSVQALSGS